MDKSKLMKVSAAVLTAVSLGATSVSASAKVRAPKDPAPVAKKVPAPKPKPKKAPKVALPKAPEAPRDDAPAPLR